MKRRKDEKGSSSVFLNVDPLGKEKSVRVLCRSNDEFFGYLATGNRQRRRECPGDLLTELIASQAPARGDWLQLKPLALHAHAAAKRAIELAAARLRLAVLKARELRRAPNRQGVLGLGLHHRQPAGRRGTDGLGDIRHLRGTYREHSDF